MTKPSLYVACPSATRQRTTIADVSIDQITLCGGQVQRQAGPRRAHKRRLVVGEELRATVETVWLDSSESAAGWAITWSAARSLWIF